MVIKNESVTYYIPLGPLPGMTNRAHMVVFDTAEYHYVDTDIGGNSHSHYHISKMMERKPMDVLDLAYIYMFNPAEKDCIL